MASFQKKYIGLLGGSFDPPHKGHLGISKIAIKKLKLKKIYWVITKKNPFKNKTFYSLDERVNYANKISKSQKKIFTIHLENIVKSSRTIDMVFSEDEAWEAKDCTKKELTQFVEQLNSAQFKEIEKFFDTMPQLSHDIEVENPKTKVKSTVKLEGLASFFG